MQNYEMCVTDLDPKLRKLAKQYLTVQATSASSERLFSAFGNTRFEKKRIRLQKKTASAILFLQYNS